MALSFRPPKFDGWDATTPDEFVNQAEKYALRVRGFYDSRARWHRRFYRISGNLVILLGGALPLLATSDLQDKDLLVSLTGFIVATVTALRGFYRWDSSWVLLRGTEMSLTRRYVHWKGEQAPGADLATERQKAVALLDDLLTLREDESKMFFKDLPLPEHFHRNGMPPAIGSDGSLPGQPQQGATQPQQGA